MQPGDRITEGIVWRGIGPRKPSPSVGSLYEVQDQGDRTVILFSREAFYDPIETDPDNPTQVTMEPSMLSAAVAGDPVAGLANLQATGRKVEALAGLSVPAILKGTARTSPGGPTKSTGTPAPMMVVIFDPVTLKHPVTGHEVRLDAHAVVRPDPRWQSNKGPLNAMRVALAALATEFHRQSGWVLAPAA